MLSKEYLKEVINSSANELTIALATELLSLREQLAVQKKHSADVLRVADSNGDCMLSWMLQYKEAEHKLNSVRQFIDDECFVIDPEDDENCIRAEYHSKYGELFTAAKPAED
ncbi:hypothetical protein ACSOQ0_001345 [Yersinia enterocolitica]